VLPETLSTRRIEPSVLVFCLKLMVSPKEKAPVKGPLSC
jgi:hypothetical protein